MYASAEQTIDDNDLACILKTALGVNKLDVSNLFEAIDITRRGKISYSKCNIHFYWTHSYSSIHFHQVMLMSFANFSC